MADEQKNPEPKPEEAQVPKTNVEDTPSDTGEENTENEEKSQNPKTEIDYEAKLKEEREARLKAEQALAKKRYQSDERKRKQYEENPDEAPDENDEDRPMTARQFNEFITKERQETQKLLQEREIRSLAERYGTTEAEINLFVEIHKNRVFPSHLSLEEQIKESVAIANKDKLIGERNEAVRALRGKQNANNNAATTHHDATQGNEPKLATDVKAILLRQKFVFNPITRQYEKKISQGRKLVYDLKTRQVKPQ